MFKIGFSGTPMYIESVNDVLGNNSLQNFLFVFLFFVLR